MCECKWRSSFWKMTFRHFNCMAFPYPILLHHFSSRRLIHWQRKIDKWVFTDCKNTRFEKKSILQNTNIWIWAPLPIIDCQLPLLYQATCDTVFLSIFPPPSNDIHTISIAKFVRWLQLQRTLPSPRTRSNLQPSWVQSPRPKSQYEHKVVFVSPRAILRRAILTGSLKFSIGNLLILPAITKLFKRLDVLVMSSMEAAKNFVCL